jgi:hypothetical protein
VEPTNQNPSHPQTSSEDESDDANKYNTIKFNYTLKKKNYNIKKKKKKSKDDRDESG